VTKVTDKYVEIADTGTYFSSPDDQPASAAAQPGGRVEVALNDLHFTVPGRTVSRERLPVVVSV